MAIICVVEIFSNHENLIHDKISIHFARFYLYNLIMKKVWGGLGVLVHLYIHA